MTRRISTIVVLSLLAVVFVAMTAHAVKSPDESPRVTNPLVHKAMHYALPYADESNTGPLDAVLSPHLGERASLGQASSSRAPFPGVSVGNTWYDMQHNGRMTRMVDWGNDVAGGEGFMVHFLWMRLATHIVENRHYAYNVYYAEGGSAGSFHGQQPIQTTGYAGYVSLDVTDDGRGVLCGHNNPGTGYSAHTYWDLGPGAFLFQNNTRVPDTTNAAGAYPGAEPIWPSIRYQEHPTDENLNVLHVFTQVSEDAAATPQALIYFRKVGKNDLGEWDYPPYVPDTVFDIAQDVACSNTDGKVALVWIANLPEAGDCDTCSSNTGLDWTQLDNDLYYQISYDYGATFSPRVNLTSNVDGEAGYRPFTDCQALITDDNDLHIGWSGRVWPADANSGGSVGYDCSMFHWGENVTCGIRTVAKLEWDQTNCDGGAWQMQGSKMNISECNGNLYFVWSQFNNIPLGIDDDCHMRALGGGTAWRGAGNAELYLAVSDDYGLTWDAPRNLTNTYTSNCHPDPGEPGSSGPCRSEHWSSMNRHGTNLTGNMPPDIVIDPSGEYTGDYFLDVQYIGDIDPGTALQDPDQSTWQNSDVMWFRLACVDPIQTAKFEPSWHAIDFPEYTEHGTAYIKPLTIENGGNANTVFSFALTEDPGPHSGWLTVSAEFTGTVTIPYGCENTVSGTVTINGDLAINYPGTIVHLSGNMTATGNMTPNVVVMPIDFWIVDTLISPAYDTISTGCFSLVVANTGNWGHQGTGEVNLDFFNYGDCDNAEPGSEGDTLPGDATIYAYDASPVICWPSGDSVLCNWSIFGTSYVDDEAFFPWSHVPPVDMGDFELYQSEFVTRDTGILFKKLWIAPYDQGPAGCNFIIQVLKIMRHPLATGDERWDSLNIGEAIDWDIPSDSASRNLSGFDAPNRLVYQQGQDYEPDAAQCQPNEDRYGGIALLDIVEIEGNDTLTLLDGEVLEQYGVYTEDNDTWVYPASGFVAEELNTNMTNFEGYNKESDSLDNDLHSMMTFRHNYTLTDTTTRLIIFKCLITTRNGYASFIANVEACYAWYLEHLVPKVTGACCIGEDCYVMNEQACIDAGGTYKGDGVSCIPNPCLGCCIGIRGNVDYDPGDVIDISDLVYLVDYMFTGGPEPQCFEEADMNGDLVIDISDLVMLVDYMFTGGPPPFDCP